MNSQHDISACQNFFTIFSQIGRKKEICNYYYGSRKALLVKVWQNASLTDIRPTSFCDCNNNGNDPTMTEEVEMEMGMKFMIDPRYPRLYFGFTLCLKNNLKTEKELIESSFGVKSAFNVEVYESENFLTLPEDALIFIIKQDDLQLEESKIWQYIIQWGRSKIQLYQSIWTIDNFLTLKTILDIFEMIFPYQQILDLIINSKFLAPNKPISSIVLPPRKTTLSSNIIAGEHTLEISSGIDRGSRDGFDVKTIYEICNKVSNTIIVLKVRDTEEILGGYNPCELDKNKDKWIYSQDRFAFLLKTTNLKNSILSSNEVFEISKRNNL
ncbi:hypothetical protein Glove_74g194 [Diversispora epigaea]|uniref:Uncharacterized protein n=1 Tax=Diversispora epigaea TaxID=1348612 RepID=A0A397JCM1_9GLOM|nr:hypothetical protein Glove_74g194 [Diversispora epigaea]